MYNYLYNRKKWNSFTQLFICICVQLSVYTAWWYTPANYMKCTQMCICTTTCIHCISATHLCWCTYYVHRCICVQLPVCTALVLQACVYVHKRYTYVCMYLYTEGLHICSRQVQSCVYVHKRIHLSNVNMHRFCDSQRKHINVQVKKKLLCFWCLAPKNQGT